MIIILKSENLVTLIFDTLLRELLKTVNILIQAGLTKQIVAS